MASQPGESGDSWTTVNAQDHSNSLQPSANSWLSQGTPVTSQDLRALDASSWMNVAQGSVDMGLSPVLSHESQNSHTLNSFSEADVPFLPPGLDLSFIGEASWPPQGHVTYPAFQCVPQDFSSSAGVSPQHVPYGVATGYLPHSSRTNVACGPQQQVFHYPGAPAALPKRSGCDQPTSHGRPLLPRTDEYPFQGVPSSAGYVPLQPRSPSLGEPKREVRVSSASALPTESMASLPASIRSVRYMDPTSQTISASPVGQMLTPRSDGIPVGTPSLIADQANEDFSSFIQYDHEDKMPTTAARSEHILKRSMSSMTNKLDSYLHGYGPANASPVLATPEQDGASRNPANSSTGHSMSSENDEGRYRNHPLYSEGPHADGLYHCPFKSDPSCQHKPTKLKCNYEYDRHDAFQFAIGIPVLSLTFDRSKFIDSHLKPFRCKIEACSKQEFSSTACLLRHEREAHGMHGHGDRPHLCFYPGCERGISGNGFPRRYNLYDHMRRVHDHKDEPTNQEMPSSGSQRKSGGRKRRASSASDEPAAQRVKVQPKREAVQMVAMPPTGSAPTVNEYHDARSGLQRQRSDHSRQRVLYSQWAQQRDLINFQMSSVQGPDDEVNLQRLSQNIEELRRLSQQARQG